MTSIPKLASRQRWSEEQKGLGKPLAAQRISSERSESRPRSLRVPSRYSLRSGAQSGGRWATRPPPHGPGWEGACGSFTFKTLHLLNRPPSLSPPAVSWTLHDMSVNGVSGFGAVANYRMHLQAQHYKIFRFSERSQKPRVSM